MKQFIGYFLAVGLYLSIGQPDLFGQSELSDVKHYIQTLENSSELQNATLSVTIFNLETQTFELQHHSDKSLVPASVLKLITTGIALDVLGKDFRFPTLLYADTAGLFDKNRTHVSIYIEGHGDPLLGSYRYKDTKPDVLFDCWATALSEKLSVPVDGKIYYNSSIFDPMPVADTWQWADVGNYFGCGALGLNFHENMFFLTVFPSSDKENGVDFRNLTPQYPLLHFRNSASVSNDEDILQRDIGFFGDPFQYERTIYGAISPNRKGKTIRGAVPRADKMLCLLFAKFLRQKGLLQTHIDDSLCIPCVSALKEEEKQKLVQLHTHRSHPLSDIIRYTNHTSNNLYAESLFKYLGHRHSGNTGSHHSGSSAVKSWLAENGINVGGIRIADGCGLSRNNLLTGKIICEFLRLMYAHPSYADFSRSLPLAGRSGTMKNHLKNTPAENNMRVKSGSMEGIIGYAGYVRGKDQTMRCFAVMLNNHTGNYSAIREKLLNLLSLLSSVP